MQRWPGMVVLFAFACLPAPAAEDADIATLIAQLGESKLATRLEAMRQLESIGDPALGPLREIVKSQRDPDIRLRAAVAAYRIETKQTVAVRIFLGHQGWAGRVVLTPDGKRAVSLGADGLKLWDVEKGELLRSFAEGQAGWGLSMTPDGKAVLATAPDHIVRLWELESGKQLREFRGHRDFVWVAALSSDGKLAATGGQDRSLVLWDVSTGKEVWRADGLTDMPRCACFTPDGTKLIVGHFLPGRGTLRVWDVKAGKELLSLAGHTNYITSVTLSPDARQVMSASFDGTVRLWNLETGRELQKLTANARGVDHAMFLPDGKRIVTCDWDGDQVNGDRSVRVFDLARGSQLRRYEGHTRGPATVVVTPDGKHAVTAAKDGTLRMWRLP